MIDREIDYNKDLGAKVIEFNTVNDEGEQETVLISHIEQAIIDGILDAHKEWAYEDQMRVFIEQEGRELAEERKRLAEKENKDG